MDPQLLNLDLPCPQAIGWLTAQLHQAGLRVLRTFDLHLTQPPQAGCPCPPHSMQACDTQLVVLLVYARSMPPVTLTAHGCHGHTWFTLVDNPQQKADPELELRLRRAMGSFPANLPAMQDQAA